MSNFELDYLPGGCNAAYAERISKVVCGVGPDARRRDFTVKLTGRVDRVFRGGYGIANWLSCYCLGRGQRLISLIEGVSIIGLEMPQRTFGVCAGLAN